MHQELRKISIDIRTGALPLWRIPHFVIRLIDWLEDSKVLVFDGKLGWKDVE